MKHKDAVEAALAVSKYRATLEERLETLMSETKEIRDKISQLGQSGIKRSTTSTSSVDLIMNMEGDITFKRVQEESTRPSAALRSQLTYLAKTGKLIRVAWGTYRKNPSLPEKKE